MDLIKYIKNYFMSINIKKQNVNLMTRWLEDLLQIKFYIKSDKN